MLKIAQEIAEDQKTKGATAILTGGSPARNGAINKEKQAINSLRSNIEKIKAKPKPEDITTYVDF